jgi:hypothetical protein
MFAGSGGDEDRRVVGLLIVATLVVTIVLAILAKGGSHGFDRLALQAESDVLMEMSAVVLIWACPRSSFTTMSSTPCSSRSVATECRRS